MKVFAMTHIGCVRKKNQDNFYCNGVYKNMEADTYKYSKEQALDGLYAVFDGMGGLSFGEEAAYLAVRALEQYQSEHVAFDGEDAIRFLNHSICCKAEKRQTNMGSTVVLFEYADGWVQTYNVGDSKCFLLRGQKMRQLTKDHTEWENMKKICGNSKMETFEWSRHILTQYLGVKEEEFFIEPFVSEKMESRTGDLFLLCSDGLTECVDSQRIEQVLSGRGPLEEKGDILLELAKKVGGKDNITILLLEM